MVTPMAVDRLSLRLDLSEYKWTSSTHHDTHFSNQTIASSNSDLIPSTMKILLFLLISAIGCINGARLGYKGNMRGIIVDVSSMSPREAAMIRKIIYQNCIKTYGRFADQFF